MGLNGKSLKEAMNGGFRNPALLGCFPDGPMASGLGLSRQSSFQQRRNLFVFDGTRTARAQFIVQSGQTPLDKPASPLPNSSFGPLQTACDLGVASAFRRPEYDFSASDDGVGQRAGSRQTGHLNPLILVQNKLGFGATDGHSPA